MSALRKIVAPAAAATAANGSDIGSSFDAHPMHILRSASQQPVALDYNLPAQVRNARERHSAAAEDEFDRMLNEEEARHPIQHALKDWFGGIPKAVRKYVLPIYIATNAGVALTTGYAVSRGSSELNPEAASLMRKVGVLPAVGIEHIAIPAIVAAAILPPIYGKIHKKIGESKAKAGKAEADVKKEEMGILYTVSKHGLTAGAALLTLYSSWDFVNDLATLAGHPVFHPPFI